MSRNPLFHGKIEYNAGNLEKLSLMISSTFHTGRKLCLFGVCLLMIVFGGSIGYDRIQGMALACAGAFLFPLVNGYDRYKARHMLELLNGNVVTMQFMFYEQEFSCSNPAESNSFSYDTIIRMVDGEEDWYLFPNRQQAYMIDKSTLFPRKADAFMAFMTEKTGLQWTQPRSLLSLNLLQILHERKNTKKPGKREMPERQ
jgi:hypothetical protein